MSALTGARAGAERWLRARFTGDVTPWPYAVARIGVALLVLVRSSDVLRPILDLDHHRWVRGLEYAPESEDVTAPALHAPLVPMPPLGDTVTTVLAYARIAFAITLLLGIRARTSAALVGVVGYVLMAADRFRYLHHLHLLWLTCLLLAFTPCGDRLSLEGGATPPRAPRWPLQVLRFHALVIYVFAGLAKLRADWLDGSTLAALERIHLVGGARWEWLVAHLGRPAVALGACAIELGLVPLLAVRRTRTLGVALGLVFHTLISDMMMVSTFGATMALYLLLFLPWREQPEATAVRSSG